MNLQQNRLQQLNPMLAKTNKKHTIKGLKQPQFEQRKLCRIVFSLDDSEYQIEIFPDSKISQLARQLSTFLDLDCGSFFEEEIISKMEQLYRETEQDDRWKLQMLNVMKKDTSRSQLQNNGKRSMAVEFDSNSFVQWRKLAQVNQGKRRWYFETNEIKDIQENQEISQQNLEDDDRCPEFMTLYDKAIHTRNAKDQRISKYKLEREKEKMSECTFHPRILSKTPGRKEQIFERLYQNAFDIKRRKEERFSTIQSQIDQENSKLSFIPEINDCSREIVRMRNSSLEESGSLNKQHCQSFNLFPKKNFKGKLGNINNSSKKSIHSKKNPMFPFRPQLSSNTLKITENLPNFEERLLRYQLQNKKRHSPHKIPQKKNLKSSTNSMAKLSKSYRQSNKVFQNNSHMKEPENKQTERMKRQSSKYFQEETSKKAINMSKILKPKKQLYQLDSLFTEDESIINQPSFRERALFQDVTSKVNNQPLKISQKPIKFDKQSRSKQLYNTRKNVILQRIYQYLVEKRHKTVSEFSQTKNKNSESSEIESSMIRSHPHLPAVIKSMFEPMANQLDELKISLDKDEFIWSLQKIYESLNVGDKGVLLGWGVKLLPEGSSFI